jgi:hypothetical protein
MKKIIVSILTIAAIAGSAPSAYAISQTDVRTGAILTAQRYARAHSSSGNLPVSGTLTYAFSYWVNYPNYGRGCARFKLDQWLSTDLWVKIHMTVFASPYTNTGYYDFGSLSAKDIYANDPGSYDKPPAC